MDKRTSDGKTRGYVNIVMIDTQRKVTPEQAMRETAWLPGAPRGGEKSVTGLTVSILFLSDDLLMHNRGKHGFGLRA